MIRLYNESAWMLDIDYMKLVPKTQNNIEVIRTSGTTNRGVYTLSGLNVKRINGGTEDILQGIPAGIYIVNGKKVVRN